MAVQFSAVTVTAGGEEVKLFVGGVPKRYDDLEGWRVFEAFLGELDQESKVRVHAQSYLYGEEEVLKATPEEVAYFMMRMERNPNFLQDSCSKSEVSDFDFTWSSEELFGMERKWHE